MDPVVQTLVTQLSNNEADVAEMQPIYDDVLTQLAAIPILVSLLTNMKPQNGLVSIPGNIVTLLLAFYNNAQIGELSIREANWLLPDWRESTGTPYNFVRESFQTQNIQLVPTPTDNNNAQILGAYTTETLPVWLQLPVALLVLGDEYQRESDHQKLEVSAAARALGQLLIQMLIGKGDSRVAK